jgi:hypothetical protein
MPDTSIEGRPPAGFAAWWPSLMSSVGPHRVHALMYETAVVVQRASPDERVIIVLDAKLLVEGGQRC